MAKASVTLKCSECGREYERTQTVRNRAEAERWESYHKNDVGMCYDCYRADKSKQRDAARSEALAAADAAAKEQGYPALVGSDKQIAWAMTLRDALMTHVADKYKPSNDMGRYNVEQLRNKLLSHVDAKWWIDNTQETLAYPALLKQLQSEVAHETYNLIMSATQRKQSADVAPAPATVSDNNYVTLNQLIDWINKRDRPRLRDWLIQHLDGVVYSELPAGKDSGGSLTIICSGLERDGSPGLYAVSDVNYTKEILMYANISDAIERVIAERFPSSPPSASSEKKKNERNAGRKPLSAELVTQIKICRANGLSVRKTAAKLGISATTVQRYM